MNKPSTHHETAEDRREAYLPPELRDLGKVVELTKTGATKTGADSAYS